MNTELAIPGLYKAVMRFSLGKIRKRLRAEIHFSHKLFPADFGLHTDP